MGDLLRCNGQRDHLKMTINDLIWASAEHWLNNWKNPTRAVIHSAACPLCRVFIEGYPFSVNTCIDCPVRSISGKRLCVGTPWEDAYLAMYFQKEFDIEVFRFAVEQEYRFLVCLALGDFDEAKAFCYQRNRGRS